MDVSHVCILFDPTMGDLEPQPRHVRSRVLVPGQSFRY